MEELFENVSIGKKKAIELMYEAAISKHSPEQAAKILDTFARNYLKDEELEFFEFFMRTKFELNREGKENV